MCRGMELALKPSIIGMIPELRSILEANVKYTVSEAVVIDAMAKEA